MENLNYKSVCVDFDGVIHSFTSPWQSESVITDPPVEGAFEWLAELVQHYKVVIFSTRCALHQGRWAMDGWFRKWGMDPGVLEQLHYAKEKPPAIMYVDDRAYLFQGPGTFPSIEQIKLFQLWNKKG